MHQILPPPVLPYKLMGNQMFISQVVAGDHQLATARMTQKCWPRIQTVSGGRSKAPFYVMVRYMNSECVRHWFVAYKSDGCRCLHSVQVFKENLQPVALWASNQEKKSLVLLDCAENAVVEHFSFCCEVPLYFVWDDHGAITQAIKECLLKMTNLYFMGTYSVKGLYPLCI